MGELENLRQAIAALESQREALGAAVVDAALGPLRARLADLQIAEGEPETQRKLATLLFMDMAGHTALTHHLDPEEQMEIIDDALARLAEPVAQHGGRVVRFQGDGYKAVFGLPTASEDDPDRAVRAGLAIQAAAGEIAAQLERERGLAGFAVRVGIATGLVLGGGGTEGDAAVRGEPVNLAARLESLAKPGTVLIAHSTHLHVRGVFDLLSLPPVQAKGFEEPVPVYQVLREKTRTFRTRRRGVEGVATPMVGRDRELALLQSVYTSMLADGRGRLVAIIGEPGLGKSRLLYEFESWLEQRPEAPHRFRGRARLETTRLPYDLLRDLLAHEVELNDGDRAAGAFEKLAQGIARLAGPGREDWAESIGRLIGLASPGGRLLGILDDAEQLRDLAFAAAIQLFKIVVGERPGLVFLEDIHWADDGSLEFFERLAHECRAERLMLVCLARNTLFERRPDWAAGLEPIRLDLAPLSDRDSARLVGEILKMLPGIPAEIHNLIVAQAEGNPFYVEEVIKMLIDDGVILPGRERWDLRLDRFTPGKIPPTLTGVLQARLDSLPRAERRTLDRVSAAGREFWDDLAARLREPDTPPPAEEVAGVLGNLLQRDLIYPKAPSSFSGLTEYRFKHAVLREVTYERLLARLRRSYHLQVAGWLSERSGERLGEYAGRIGEHYELGGAPLQAAEWYFQAARQAQDAYASDTAGELYRKALEIWEQAGETSQLQIEALAGLGQVLTWLGRFDESIEAYTRMARAAEAGQDPAAHTRAWLGITEAQMHRGEARAALESARQAEQLAILVDAQLDLAKALWMQAWGAFRLGELQSAHVLATRVEALSRRLDDRSQTAHSLNLLGVLASVGGRYTEAEGYFQRALEIFRGLGNRRRAMPLLNNLGVIREARGDYTEALRHYRDALDMAREIGNREGEMVYLSNLGGVKVRLGEHAAAEADLLCMLGLVGTGSQNVLPSTYSYLAEARLGLNRPFEALDAAQQSLALARAMESQESLGEAWRSLGLVAAALGSAIPVPAGTDAPEEQAEARLCFNRSAQIFAQLERLDEHARTLLEWGRYEQRQGDTAEGLRLWDQARQTFDRLGIRSELERMESIHAKTDDG